MLLTKYAALIAVLTKDANVSFYMLQEIKPNFTFGREANHIKSNTLDKELELQEDKAGFTICQKTNDIKLETLDKVMEVLKTGGQECLRSTNDIKLETIEVKLVTEDKNITEHKISLEIPALKGGHNDLLGGIQD